MRYLRIFALLIICTSIANAEERGINIDVSPGHAVKIGRQYLLLIAVDRYSDWPDLKNPVKDARELRSLLESRYRIDETVELYDTDASKSNILKKFSDLQKALLPEDSLVVFYAGHGHFDRNVTNSGFWIPSNGGTDPFEQANWIPNSQIRGVLSRFKANHILLISDSCFSGDILDVSRGIRITESPEEGYMRHTYPLTARQVITSGAEESVPDQSEFFFQLKNALMKNEDPYLDTFTLYLNIKKGVRKTFPLIGELKDTGHQDGASFFFFLKSEAENEISVRKTETAETGSGQSSDISTAATEAVPVAFRPPMTPSANEAPAATIMMPPYDSSRSDTMPKIASKDTSESTSPMENPSSESREGSKNGVFVRISSGPLIPVLDTVNLMSMGFESSIGIGYRFRASFGILRFSLVSGFSSASVRGNLSTGYESRVIPIGTEATYGIPIGTLFEVFVSMGGGELLNLISYKDNSSLTVFSPFLIAALGGHFFFSREWSVGVTVRSNASFFSNMLSTDVTPGIMIEYCF